MPVIAAAPTLDSDPYLPCSGDWRHEAAVAVMEVRSHRFFPTAVLSASVVRGSAYQLSDSARLSFPPHHG